jgi:hypothetical protein
MSAIPFRGSITQENYLRATRLALRPSRSLAILLGLGAAGLLFAFVVEPLVAGAGVREVLPFLVVAPLFAAMAWFVIPRSVLRALKSNKLLQAPIEGSAAEDAISMRTPTGTATLPWDLFYRVKASENMVLLYQGINVFNMFPQEFFASEEDWRTFRSWALARTPGEPTKNPLWRLLRRMVFWIIVFVLILFLYNVFRER